MLDLHVNPSSGIGSLLKEHGVTGDLGNIDGYAQTLTGKNGIHDGNVLVRKVATDGKDENPRKQGRRNGGIGRHG